MNVVSTIAFDDSDSDGNVVIDTNRVVAAVADNGDGVEDLRKGGGAVDAVQCCIHLDTGGAGVAMADGRDVNIVDGVGADDEQGVAVGIDSRARGDLRR